ncbi:MAG: polysaccharide biosynthesis tyrosine autokinase [Planctomycetaceae bacterium]|nr:polysaccharide biosynthesis tyrosine autokinase [Planctomycetaceae bacterium]
MITSNNSVSESTPVISAPVFERGATKKELGLFDIFEIVKRQWGLIVFGVFLGIVIGMIYFAKAERLYESKVVLSVIEKNPDASKIIGTTNTSNYYVSAQDSVLSTHMLYVTSDWVIRKACDELKKLNDTKRLGNFYEQEKEGNLFEYVTKNITVTKGGEGTKTKNAMVLNASYVSPSKEESQLVLSYIVKAYIEYVAKTYDDPTLQITEQYEKTRDSFTEQVAQLSNDISEYIKEAPHSFVALRKDGPSMYQQKLEEYEKALTQLDLDKNQYGKRLEAVDQVIAGKPVDKIDNNDAISLLVFSGDNTVKDLQAMSQSYLEAVNANIKRFSEDRKIQKDTAYKLLLDKQLQRSQLMLGLGAGREEVAMVDSDIAILEDTIKKISLAETGFADQEKFMTPSDLLMVYRNGLENKLKEVESRATTIREMVEKERESSSAFVRWSNGYDSLVDQRNMKIQVLNETIKKLTDHDAMQTSAGFWVDQLLIPTEAKFPVWPNPLIVFGAAVLLGVFMGCFLAYIADLSDRTFHSPAEVTVMVGIPVLAQLPKLHSIQRKRKWLRSTKRAGVIAEEVITFHRPKSQEAETFRGLRTSLLVGLKMVEHSVLQVTSTNPHDGKTTVATNLAVSVANSRRRVLLIDCDLRSPNLHSIFGIVNGVGLSNYLYGEKTFEEVLLATPVENLTLVTAGTSRTNPAEMLSSLAFKKFLQEAREKYDLVVLDTPPVLAVSDACIMASEVDGVLMTVRITKNGRPAVLHATHLLREVGAVLCGVVINNFRSHRFYNAVGGQSGYGSYGYDYSYGYGYGYSYGYSYGSDSDSSSRKSSQNPAAVKQEKTVVSK